MPFVTALLAGFARLFGPLLIQFLISLGVGAVTYTGVKALLDYAEGQVHTLIGGMGSAALQIVSACGGDVAISIIFGALAVRMTLMGMSAAGSVTKWRLGGGGGS